MAKSTVKRKRFIRSYAGFTTGAAKYTIEPMTRDAAEYARSRVPRDTGALASSITWDLRGTAGAIKAGKGVKMVTLANGRQASLAVIIEYGTPKMKARSFMRYGVRKALREMRKHWKAGLEEARREQST